MKPTVYMMLGLPGSGKTTFSKNLAKQLGLRRFAIDEEYSRIGGDLHNHVRNRELAARAGEEIKKFKQRNLSQLDNQSSLIYALGLRCREMSIVSLLILLAQIVMFIISTSTKRNYYKD